MHWLGSNCFMEALLSRFSASLRVTPMPAGAVLQQTSDQSCPAGLVTGPQPPAGVAVEVLVEQEVITPVRVVRVACEGAVAGPRPALLRHEQGTEPLREFVRHPLRSTIRPEPVGHSIWKLAP